MPENNVRMAWWTCVTVADGREQQQTKKAMVAPKPYFWLSGVGFVCSYIPTTTIRCCLLVHLFAGSSCAFACFVRFILALLVCIACKPCFLYPYLHVRAIFHVQVTDFVTRPFLYHASLTSLHCILLFAVSVDTQTSCHS